MVARTLLIILFCGLIIAPEARSQSLEADYALTDKFYLPGPTRWDYLAYDPDHKSLFITRGDRVDVLDVESHEIIGSIPDTPGVHGVALAPGLGKGFTSNGTDNSITVFELATLRTLANIPAGKKPDAIVFDPKTQRVFAADGDSHEVTVIDAVTGGALPTIKLDGKPEFAVTDGARRLYINIEDKSELAVIDSQNLNVVSYYNLAPNCDSPTGLAIDKVHDRLFSVCGNRVMVVIEAKTGKIIDKLPIGAHSDAALFDAGTGLAFSSNGDGTLTVIGSSSPDHYEVLESDATLPSARTMALDPLTHKLYLAAAVIDGGDNSGRSHLKLGSFMILTVAPQTDRQTD